MANTARSRGVGAGLLYGGGVGPATVDEALTRWSGSSVTLADVAHTTGLALLSFGMFVVTVCKIALVFAMLLTGLFALGVLAAGILLGGTDHDAARRPASHSS